MNKLLADGRPPWSARAYCGSAARVFSRGLALAAVLVAPNPAAAAPTRGSAAPTRGSAAKTEAILAFDDGGSEAVRYYARKGAKRVALPGEPDKLVVDAVAGSPEVTAILVAFPGAAAPDKDEAEGRLFAFGDTVNARVRQASGGKRGITGSVVGPVTVEAVAACDLNALGERAMAAAKADLSRTDVVLILAPQAACRFSGAATLGRVRQGRKRMAVAWAFGDGWVAASAHALEHAMGARHAAAGASDDFGWAAATAAKATIAKKPADRASRAGKKDEKEPLLTLASVAGLLDAPGPAMTGLRDAPTALRPGPAMGLRPAAEPRVWAAEPRVWAAEPRVWAAGPAASRILERAAKPAFAAKAPAFDAVACRESARQLRDAAKAASAGGNAASGLVARRRLAAVVKDQEAALAARDVPMDIGVSLLTTDAETELHVALARLQDPKLSAKAVKGEVLPAVKRAADSLDQAARRLSRR